MAQIGGTGFAAPASFTSQSGHVRVTIVGSVAGTAGDDIIVQGERDTSAATFIGEVVTIGDTSLSASFCMVFLDTVTPATAHVWGVNIAAGDNARFTSGSLQIIVEDT